MSAFDHYAEQPAAVAAAERDLMMWRREALAERGRAGQSAARDGRLKAAERRIADLRAFLAPRPAEPPTPLARRSPQSPD